MPEELLRLCVGLEDVEDLWDDLRQALDLHADYRLVECSLQPAMSRDANPFLFGALATGDAFTGSRR